jgi:hypothetical protein
MKSFVSLDDLRNLNIFWFNNLDIDNYINKNNYEYFNLNQEDKNPN